MKSFLVCIAALSLCSIASAADFDWSKVEQALGKKGAAQPGGVYKFGFPRSDLKVTVDGVAIKPSLALGSWLAFVPTGDGAMVMGDLVLTESEISAVMKHLVDNGLEISAVHNHLLRASPAVVYMHVGGHGDAAKLAQVLHDALALSKTPLAAAAPSGAPPAIDLDVAAIESALGTKGTNNGGVYQFSIPRAEQISAHGMAVPAALGTSTAINFQPTGGGKAAITGDFVMIGKEVNAVIKALRTNGIEVTALHSHMIDDSPHLYFMHFWANDDAGRLAKTLRTALDAMNVKRGS
jgi:biotin operon repressor